MAKLAIIEQTVQFCCVFIYENDCGNVPNIRKRLQYVLWGGVSYCVVGIILNCCTKLLLLLKYLLRQTDDCDFHIIGQEIFNLFLYFCK